MPKLPPGQKVVVEVDLPDGEVYKGREHIANDKGSIRSTYRTTAGSPVGTYQVKVVAEGSTHDTGHFDVTR